MGIRLIAMDLDQTALNREGRLSEHTQRVLEELLERGIQVVPASGRPLAAFPEDVMALKGLQYAIASNGTAIYHLPSNACLARFSLDPQIALDVLELTKGLPVAYEFYIHGKAWASRDYVEHPERYGAFGKTVAYIRATRSPFADAGEFLKRCGRDLDCMDVVAAEESLKRRLMEIISRRCRGVYVTTSDSRLIEISNERAGKHRALACLAAYLRIGAEGIAAFGDADNDAEMLKSAGVGIAMGNATPACREAADYVTRSHEEDGVAWGIREILGL
ncbi:MAG TPA: HAD-IIB family hydrolase [Candidatus Eisenbergiella pullicola]|nr:HAD-IIB family hydrolase [Candidatus Eisenbergiella pullicola]